MGRRLRITADVRPLRSANFRRLWVAGAVTAVGSQLTAVVIPLQIYAFTGSSAYVGLAGLVGFAPMVAGALWGGALADAVDRRRMLLATNGGIGATSVLLWAQAATHLRSVGLLLCLVAVQQALFGANAAASGAAIPRLVPAADLPAANVLRSTVVSSAGIAGPLLAGGLLPVVGGQPLYLADAAALCATLWAVTRLPPLPPQAVIARRTDLWQALEGFRVLATHSVLLAAYLADFAALFLGLPVALFPQLAREHFGAVGALYAAISIGGVAAGLLSGSFTRTRRHGVAITAAVCVWGLAIAGLGLARSLLSAMLLLTLAGGALIVLSAFRKSILQTAATDGLRGRLQAADTVVAAGGPRLADFAHGAAGAAFGTTWTVTGGGVLTIAAMLTLVAASPDLRRYRVPSPAQHKAD
ncbi:MFS transporter [Actinomadura sp. DC4]|uniref:MFS transporter n=1 Tax=Actinomadura sp. DC4 TaxID=3055069 RepID=UPI0025B1CD36|nr:MFS transporter [Actinomadura sp. DC4]MDN3353161.1 MFS transporter [Actinomadura sp. DC4]